MALKGAHEGPWPGMHAKATIRASALRIFTDVSKQHRDQDGGWCNHVLWHIHIHSDQMHHESLIGFD